MTSPRNVLASARLSNALQDASLWGLRLFLAFVFFVSLRNGPRLFLSSPGRSHRVVGGLLFAWIIIGALTCGIDVRSSRTYLFLYDVVLGCLGIATTMTAARDFPHRLVKNDEGQSGSLAETATVTQAEMIEHAFYQLLNLVQIIYLYGMALGGPSLHYLLRLGALLMATSPWYIRRRFPVHGFSSNWNKAPGAKRAATEELLYKIKKLQYIFYKHFVLHGINVSVALNPSDLPWSRAWRTFWLHLNVSYGMEFFLQSLVKRKVLRQADMLHLQRLLITSATISAVTPIFGNVQLGACMTSLMLNFLNRYHDVFNTMLIASLGFLVQYVALV